MKKAAPSTNGPNGRDAHGRFAKGNAGGPGNPFARQAQHLRGALFAAVTTADLKAVVTKLVQLAKGGDVQAAKVVLDRALGPPVELDLIERIEQLEAAASGRKT
ncbi:MAG: hypothetical protein LLF97_07030 [Planctomycetaceae bacterium]|nr:hypothetical protein [Planctomycetaceae bacterium]